MFALILLLQSTFAISTEKASLFAKSNSASGRRRGKRNTNGRRKRRVKIKFREFKDSINDGDSQLAQFKSFLDEKNKVLDEFKKKDIVSKKNFDDEYSSFIKFGRNIHRFVKKLLRIGETIEKELKRVGLLKKYRSDLNKLKPKIQHYKDLLPILINQNKEWTEHKDWRSKNNKFR